jgi:hypothetical protein
MPILDNEKERTMRKMVTMQALVAAMLAMCLVGGCGNDDSGDTGDKGGTADKGAPKTPKVAPVAPVAPTGISAMMPSSAIGVVHIDIAKTRGGIIAAAEKDKETFGPFMTFLEPLKKIESADVYLIPGGSKPMPLVAIRGSIGPDDVTSILAQTPMKDAKLVKGENGRYTIEGQPVVMIIGDEADDVPAGVVLGGIGPMLTPEFIAALGKKKNISVEAMLSKVDTKAQIWGGVAIPKDAQKGGAPEQMFGSANITGANPLNLSFVFGEDAKAAEMMKDFDGLPPFMKEVVALKQDGLTVTASMIGEGNLIDNAIKIVKGFLSSMMAPGGAPSGSTTAPATR